MNLLVRQHEAYMYLLSVLVSLPEGDAVLLRDVAALGDHLSVGNLLAALPSKESQRQLLGAARALGVFFHFFNSTNYFSAFFIKLI